MNAAATQVFLGIGSNINADVNVANALSLLEKNFENVRQSKRYQTTSVGFNGDDFINMVVSFDTGVSLCELSQILADIEQACGRDRAQEQGKGARTIDLDVLLFGELRGSHEGYDLPRKDIYERQFVWQPLLELFDQCSSLSLFQKSLIAELETQMTNVNRLIPIA